MAAEAPGAAGPAPARGGIAGALSARMGPWPTWAWLLLITAGGLAFYLYEKHKKGASAAASNPPAAAQATAGQVTGAQNVPDYVSQVSVYNQEPPDAAAPSVPIPKPPKPPAPPTGVTRYPAPTGVTVSKLSSSSALVKFRNVATPTPAPTSYTIAAFDKGGHLAAQETVNPDEKGGMTQATLQGLKQGAYTIRVWANGGKVAPPGTNVSVRL